MKMQLPFKLNALSLVLTAVSASIAAPAKTQASDLNIEEIVVTAQRRAQSLNDLGMSVNAFNGEQMKTLGISNATDLEGKVPGLSLTDTAGLGVPVFTIRGIGFDSFNSNASATVGVYTDEISLPYPVMTTSRTFDVERIEVLKGPQGDLYGRNTTGGAINFISNKPTELFEAGISLDAGRYDTLSAEGYVSGTLTQTLQGRLAFTRTHASEGWQTNSVNGDTNGEQDAVALRGLLNWEPTADLNVLLNVHWDKDESDPLALQWISDFIPDANRIPPTHAGTRDPRAAGWGIEPDMHRELLGGSIRVDWELDGLTFTSFSAVDQFEREELSDRDGSTELEIFHANIQTDIDAWSQEFRLTSESDSNFSWIVGVFLGHDRVKEEQQNPFGDSLTAIQPTGKMETFGPVFEQETDTRALYGHGEWQLAEQVKLTVGGRYTYEERDFDYCVPAVDSASVNLMNALGNFASPIGLGDCGTLDRVFGDSGAFKDSITTEKALAKISLDYTPSDDWLIYAGISSGFKSGGFNASTALVQEQLKPFTEEDLLAYEFGVKATLLDGRLQINSAAFWYDYQDKQVTSLVAAPVFNTLGAVVNVPQSRVNGAELEAHWMPAEGLNLRLGVSYLDTLVEEYEAVDGSVLQDPANPILVDESGTELGSSPEWQYTALISYERPIGYGLIIRANTDFTYKDEQLSVNVTGAETLYKTEEYYLVNARIGIAAEDGAWEAALWGRNLTDEYYYNTTFRFVDLNWRAPGQGATYGISVSYKWQ